MALYAMLAKFTDQGAKNVRDLPARIEAFKQQARSAGGEVKQLFLAMGAYDTVSLVSAPSDEVMAKIALSLCAVGNATTETVRLFNEEEARKVLSSI